MPTHNLGFCLLGFILHTIVIITIIIVIINKTWEHCDIVVLAPGYTLPFALFGTSDHNDDHDHDQLIIIGIMIK